MVKKSPSRLGFEAFFPTGAAEGEARLVSDAVAAHVLSLVETKALRRGDKLPTERELAEKLGVSRGAVREGLRTLGIMGLVEAYVGKGRFLVREPGTLVGSSLVSDWLQRHEREMSELTEVREVLEGATIRSIPLSDVDELTASMRGVLVEAEEAMTRGDLAAVVRADRKFHQLPLDCGSNRSLAALTTMILEATRPTALAVLSVMEAAKSSLVEHRRIVEAFENRDPELAAVLTGHHERSSYKRVLDARAHEILPIAREGGR